MARTTAETMGVCERVLEFIRANHAAISAKGIGADGLIDGLQEALDAFVHAESAHERMKAETREQGAKSRTAKRTADKKGSDTIRIVAGALGSDTELGKQVVQLSSDVRRSRSTSSSPEPPTSG